MFRFNTKNWECQTFTTHEYCDTSPACPNADILEMSRDIKNGLHMEVQTNRKMYAIRETPSGLECVVPTFTKVTKGDSKTPKKQWSSLSTLIISD